MSKQDSYTPKPRINGSMLRNYVGKTVILAGEYIKHDKNTLILKASDGKEVKVITKNPIQPEGDYALFLEIIGHVNKDLSVTEQEHTIFPDVEVHKGRETVYESFNLELYDKMIKLTSGKYKDLFY